MYGKIYCYENDMITRQLKRFSAHTRNEISMLKDFIETGDVVIDIGAHIGTYTLPFSQFVGESGAVYSFEANVENFELLSKNLDENSIENVTKINAIVSDKKQSFQMHYPVDGNTGTYYFLPNTEAEHNSTSIVMMDEYWFTELGGPKVNLLKIDVEGAEFNVLNSCEELIKKYLPVIYIEINIEALSRFDCDYGMIESWLRSHRYELYRNVGKRNSINDEYELERIVEFPLGVELFDVLAISLDNNECQSKLTALLD